MKPADLAKEIESGCWRPVYLFYGQDILLQKEYAAGIAGMVGEGLRDFNLETLSAEDATPAEVIERALSMPFLSPPRVIILRGADRYSSTEMIAFKEYLDRPNDSSCLVLLAEKPDFRLGFYKNMQQLGLAVIFDPPRGRELPAWVVKTGEQLGYTVTPNAARILIDRVGQDMTRLKSELEKVCLYAGDKKKVGAAEVEAAASLSRTATIFELGDAVGEQNQDKALTALKSLLFREHPLMILSMILRHFHLLLKARMLLDTRGSLSEAPGLLGVPAFAARNYLNQAGRLNTEQLKHGLASLLKADLALKSSGAPDRLILEGLILDLTSLKKKAGDRTRPA